MSKLSEYTLVISKRTAKHGFGLKPIETKEFAPVTKDFIDSVVKRYRDNGFTVNLIQH